MYTYKGLWFYSEKKKQNLIYGELTTEEVEAIPWDILPVDILVSYKIRREGSEKPLILKALAIIHPTTGWFEIVKYNDKQAATK